MIKKETIRSSQAMDNPDFDGHRIELSPKMPDIATSHQKGRIVTSTRTKMDKTVFSKYKIRRSADREVKSPTTAKSIIHGVLTSITRPTSLSIQDKAGVSSKPVTSALNDINCIYTTYYENHQPKEIGYFYNQTLVYGRHFEADGSWFDVSCPEVLYAPSYRKFAKKGAVYYYNNSLKYKGEMVDGKADGYGEAFGEKGDLLYRGHWKEGKRHGSGIGYIEGGNYFYGIWTEGAYSHIDLKREESVDEAIKQFYDRIKYQFFSYVSHDYFNDYKNQPFYEFYRMIDNKEVWQFSGWVNSDFKPEFGLMSRTYGTVVYCRGRIYGTNFTLEHDYDENGDYSGYACLFYKDSMHLKYCGYLYHNLYHGKGVYWGVNGQLEGVSAKEAARVDSCRVEEMRELVDGLESTWENGHRRMDYHTIPDPFLRKWGILEQADRYYLAKNHTIYVSLLESSNARFHRHARCIYEGSLKNHLPEGEGELFLDRNLILRGVFRDHSADLTLFCGKKKPFAFSAVVRNPFWEVGSILLRSTYQDSSQGYTISLELVTLDQIRHIVVIHSQYSLDGTLEVSPSRMMKWWRDRDVRRLLRHGIFQGTVVKDSIQVRVNGIKSIETTRITEGARIEGEEVYEGKLRCKRIIQRNCGSAWCIPAPSSS